MLKKIQQWMTSPVLLAALLFFLVQSQACFAEQVGLFCCTGHEVESSSSSDSLPTPDDSCECQHVFVSLTFQENRFALFLVPPSRFLNPDEYCPDGPAESIDLPPERA